MEAVVEKVLENEKEQKNKRHLSFMNMNFPNSCLSSVYHDHDTAPSIFTSGEGIFQ